MCGWGVCRLQVVILAGGYGTRISEESKFRPKPMIEIGGKPILWHIMKYYSMFGLKDFIICCGYRQEVIKEYFLNYRSYNSDFSICLRDNRITVHREPQEDWAVTLVDSGLDTMTGGRIKRIGKFLDGDSFLMTYGDGVCNVDILETIKFHEKHQRLATITTVKPEGRFGVLDIGDDGQIREFREKASQDMGWINGGYMVLNRKVLDYIEGDRTVFEAEPLQKLAEDGQMMAYKHKGFWRCMDTQRDKKALETLWEEGNAPWKIWE